MAPVTTIATPRRHKTNHKRGYLAADRDRKRSEAEERKTYYLTPDAQLARLAAGSYTATKERARLAL
jgi:hypothetical protein